jgi:3-phosphoshikimate 1-carboxyvinyltransferase
MTRVVGPLREMGAAIEASAAGTAPLVLHPRRPEQSLRPLDYRMPVASAQVKSAILLAALAGEGPTTIREPGPTRDHTERLLGSMGAKVERHPSENRVTLHPPRGPLEPLALEIPGDFSSAAFLVVAATITPGSEVTLRGVGLNPTRTGLLDALAAMGADVRVERSEERHGEPAGDILVRASKLRGTAIAGELVVRMIDEFPALAVAAAFAEGATSIRQAEELRHKETDRIAVMCRELAAVGVRVTEHPDGLTIEGGVRVPGGEAASHGDHRVAMAMALTGLAAAGPVRVRNASIIAESFPGFALALHSLGAGVGERGAG